MLLFFLKVTVIQGSTLSTDSLMDNIRWYREKLGTKLLTEPIEKWYK
jgi:hypothetical protein